MPRKNRGDKNNEKKNIKNKNGEFRGICNLRGGKGHKEADCWEKIENAHRRSKNWRSKLSRESTNSKIDVCLVCLEEEEEEEARCDAVIEVGRRLKMPI